MKWIKTSIIGLIVLLVAGIAFSEQAGPWTFRNITVLTFTSSLVDVRRAADQRGIYLSLPSWDQQLELSLKETLADSPLKYRLHPLPQAAIGVEVYSPSTDIDFAVRRQKNVTQVIIGEIRSDKIVFDLIGAKTLANPLPKKLREMLRSGKLSQAQGELHKLEVQGTYAKILHHARRSILSAMLHGADGMHCPRLPNHMESEMAHESVILSAICLHRAGESQSSLRYLAALDAMKISERIAQRLAELETHIVAGLVLSADRQANPLHASAYSIKHRDVIRKSLTETLFLEVVADNLGSIGLGGLFVGIADAEIAKIEDKKYAALVPAVVESYLNASQYVRALDAASYFLTGRQPRWYEARLKRVRGRANLQEGDWREAARDLDEAKQHLAGWNMEDDLSLIEAGLRSGRPAKSLDTLLRQVRKRVPKRHSAGIQSWIERLRAEIDIKNGRIPEDAVLERLPTHVMFEGAMGARKSGSTESYKTLIQRAARSEDGWGEFAELSAEVEAMKLELKKIKRALKVML